MSETEESKLTSSYSIISFLGKDLPSTYRNMIYSKWMRSLRHGNDYFKLMDSDSYYRAYNEHIDEILSKDTIVRLAVLTDDYDVVLGFSINRGNTLDYIHVHHSARKQGIGRALLLKNIDTITHVTNIGMSIWASKYPNWKFNPFA